MVAKGFKRKYFSLAAITATVSLSLLGAKASEVAQIQKVVVSATKEVQNIEDVTDDVEVITSEEIAEKGYDTLGELLKEVAGLDVVQTGGFGQPVSLYLEGLNPNKTLVLIDGIRFNDPTGLNGAQLELINLNNIQRVEIIKGPQSGVWGADAVAGVINIVTKKAKGGGFKIEGGSYTTLNGALYLSQKVKNLSYALDFSHFYTQGFSAYSAKKGEELYGVKASDLPLEKDGYDNKRFGFKGSYDFEGVKLGFDLIKIYSTIHYDNFGSDAPDSPFTINQVNDTLYKLTLNKNILNHKMSGEYKYSNFKRSQFGGYEGEVEEFEIKDSFLLWSIKSQAGVGYQKFFQKKSAGVITNSGYQNHYGFLTFSKKYQGFLLNGALRYDNYNKFDDKLTYKIGVKKYILDSIYMAANLATGYKAPSIFQLNYNATKDLNPEKSLGYNLIVGGDFFKVALFENKIKDQITYIDPDWNYSTPNDYYYNAKGESKFKGVEVSFFKEFFEQFWTNLSYTYLDAKDANGKRLPRRAKYKISYSLSWYPTSKHTININGYYVGDRKDFDGSEVGKYNVTNLALSHNFAKHIRGFIKVNNLFNRFYQEVNGYTTPDRSYYVGIEASY